MHKNISDFVNLGKYRAANKNLNFNPEVVFIGDSITEDWFTLFPDFFSKNHFLNRGISGQITSQILLRFHQDVISVKPKYVFILAGINDIAENLGKMEMCESLANIMMMCDLAKQNQIIPIVSTLTPVNSFFWKPEINPKSDVVLFNKHLSNFCQENIIALFDSFKILKDINDQLPEHYSRDGGHLTKMAYEELSKSFEELLNI